MGYEYKHEDLDCNYCLNKHQSICKFSLCPYIMDNLQDLNKDKNFHEAVVNAASCKSSHKYTLLHLKKENKYRYKIFTGTDYSDDNPRYDYKAECENCCYATTGFVCHKKSEVSCLMDWIKERIYVRC